MSNPLWIIEGCTDEYDCPNREWCIENNPADCPLEDPDYIKHRNVPLDKLFNRDYI
jgi:hypothetical protein